MSIVLRIRLVGIRHAWDESGIWMLDTSPRIPWGRLDKLDGSCTREYLVASPVCPTGSSGVK